MFFLFLACPHKVFCFLGVGFLCLVTGFLYFDLGFSCFGVQMVKTMVRWCGAHGGHGGHSRISRR